MYAKKVTSKYFGRNIPLNPNVPGTEFIHKNGNETRAVFYVINVTETRQTSIGLLSTDYRCYAIASAPRLYDHRKPPMTVDKLWSSIGKINKFYRFENVLSYCSFVRLKTNTARAVHNTVHTRYHEKYVFSRPPGRGVLAGSRTQCVHPNLEECHKHKSVSACVCVCVEKHGKRQIYLYVV